MSPDESQSASERNKTLVRSFVEKLLNERDPRTIDDFLCADFVDHNAPPEQPPGPEGVKRVLQRVLSVLADLHVETDDVIAEADKVAIRHRAQARHVGNFMGFPAQREKTHLDDHQHLSHRERKNSGAMGVHRPC